MANQMVGAIRDYYHSQDLPADLADTLPGAHNTFRAMFGEADI